eukprot:Hpha_TRINITY_DN19226_c0_g1::TRINITY_DN19226_c0_g1_i1::g.194320::m.194320
MARSELLNSSGPDPQWLRTPPREKEWLQTPFRDGDVTGGGPRVPALSPPDCHAAERGEDQVSLAVFEKRVAARLIGLQQRVQELDKRLSEQADELNASSGQRRRYRLAPWRVDTIQRRCVVESIRNPYHRWQRFARRAVRARKRGEAARVTLGRRYFECLRSFSRKRERAESEKRLAHLESMVFAQLADLREGAKVQQQQQQQLQQHLQQQQQMHSLVQQQQAEASREAASARAPLSPTEAVRAREAEVAGDIDVARQREVATGRASSLRSQRQPQAPQEEPRGLGTRVQSLEEAHSAAEGKLNAVHDQGAALWRALGAMHNQLEAVLASLPHVAAAAVDSYPVEMQRVSPSRAESEPQRDTSRDAFESPMSGLSPSHAGGGALVLPCGADPVSPGGRPDPVSPGARPPTALFYSHALSSSHGRVLPYGREADILSPDPLSAGGRPPAALSPSRTLSSNALGLPYGRETDASTALSSSHAFSSSRALALPYGREADHAPPARPTAPSRHTLDTTSPNHPPPPDASPPPWPPGTPPANGGVPASLRRLPR